MPTRDEVYKFIRNLKERKHEDPYGAALEEFSQPHLAVSTLQDVLGSGAFAGFFCGYNSKEPMYGGVEPGDAIRGESGPLLKTAGKRVLATARINRGYLDTYFGVNGKFHIPLRDFTKQHCIDYSESLGKTGRTLLRRSENWLKVGRRIGSKKIGEVYVTNKQVADLWKKIGEKGDDE